MCAEQEVVNRQGMNAGSKHDQQAVNMRAVEVDSPDIEEHVEYL